MIYFLLYIINYYLDRVLIGLSIPLKQGAGLLCLLFDFDLYIIKPYIDRVLVGSSETRYKRMTPFLSVKVVGSHHFPLVKIIICHVRSQGCQEFLLILLLEPEQLANQPECQ